MRATSESLEQADQGVERVGFPRRSAGSSSVGAEIHHLASVFDHGVQRGLRLSWIVYRSAAARVTFIPDQRRATSRISTIRPCFSTGAGSGLAVIWAPIAPAAPSAINEWMKTFTWVRMSPLPWGAAASETTTLTALYHTLAKPSRIILPVRSDSTTGNSGAKP